MFISKEALKEVIKDVINGKGSLEEVRRLKEEIEDLKMKKRVEEQELQHLVKMKEEKQGIESTKKELELQKAFQTKEMDLAKKYHEDMVARFVKEQENLNQIYTKIMERLPNVNLEITRGTK